MDDAAAGGMSPPPGVKLISGQVAVLIRNALRPAQREMACKARCRPSATAAWSLPAGSGFLTTPPIATRALADVRADLEEITEGERR
jgi:hypothetical protein